LGLLLLVLGCGVSASAARRELASPLPREEAFTRAMRVVADFGYTVTDADRASGFLRAERKASSGSTEFLTGSANFWVLTVTVLEDSSGTRYVLQPQNVREEGGRRTTVGVMVMKGQQAQVDSIASRLGAN
jgi:hypothetical protein